MPEKIEIKERFFEDNTKLQVGVAEGFKLTPETDLAGVKSTLKETTHLPDEVIDKAKVNENGELVVEKDGKIIKLKDYKFNDLSADEKMISEDKQKKLQEQDKAIVDPKTQKNALSTSNEAIGKLNDEGKKAADDPTTEKSWYHDAIFDENGKVKEGVINASLGVLKAGGKVGLIFLLKYLGEQELNDMADAATGCYLENDRTHALLDNMGKSIGEDNCSCGSSVVRSRCKDYCADINNFDGPPLNSYVADWCGGNCSDDCTGDPNKCENCNDTGKSHTSCGCFSHDDKTNTDKVLSPGVSFKWQKMSGLQMLGNVLSQTGLVIKGVVKTAEGAVLDITEGVKGGLSNLYKGLIAGAIVIGVVAIIGISIYVSKKFKKPPQASTSVVLSTPVQTAFPPSSVPSV